MIFFKHLKIGQKINIGFIIILSMMAFILLLNVVANIVIITSTSNVRDSSDVQTIISHLNINFSEARIWANSIYNEDKEEYFTNFNSAGALVDESFGKALVRIESSAALAPHKPKLEELAAEFASWEAAVQYVDSYYAKTRAGYNKLAELGANMSEKSRLLFQNQLLLLKDESTNIELLSNYTEAAKAFNSRSTKLASLYTYTVDIDSFRRAVFASIQSYDPADVEELVKNMTTTHIAIRRYRDLYSGQQGMADTDEVVNLVDAYRTAYKEYALVMDELIVYMEDTRIQGEMLRDSVSDFASEMDKILVNELVMVNTLTIASLVVVIIVSVVSLIFGMILAKTLVLDITKPVSIMSNTLLSLGNEGKIIFTDDELEEIREIADGKDEIAESVRTLLVTMTRLKYVGNVLETIAEGDLDLEIVLLSENDSMGKSLETMVRKLNIIFGEIVKSTDEVANATIQISGGAQALAQGSTQQAATVEELSASISMISGETMENEQRAVEATGLTNKIMRDAKKGSRQMDDMLNAVSEITEASNSISRVIKAIDDIAFQTNILALNAAVEAARAGEAGKGFAVVAEEVRKLATKSAAAAKETEALIQNSIMKAQLGADIASETAKSLDEIVRGIENSALIISKISNSSKSQALSITEINSGIDQVSNVVQQNSSTAEESAASSQEMNSQAHYLKENVSQFKLKSEVLN